MSCSWKIYRYLRDKVCVCGLWIVRTWLAKTKLEHETTRNPLGLPRAAFRFRFMPARVFLPPPPPRERFSSSSRERFRKKYMWGVLNLLSEPGRGERENTRHARRCRGTHVTRGWSKTNSTPIPLALYLSLSVSLASTSHTR